MEKCNISINNHISINNYISTVMYISNSIKKKIFSRQEKFPTGKCSVAGNGGNDARI